MVKHVMTMKKKMHMMLQLGPNNQELKFKVLNDSTIPSVQPSYNIEQV
jgi:hypothetical protein